MTTPKLIGILGGMGPEATILLQQKILAAVPAQDDRDHIPLLIDMNAQVPSRIAHLIEGTGEDPGPCLAKMAQRLETGGALALAMPCNTAHHYAQSITNTVETPLLNMVELAALRASKLVPNGGTVGMLASPAVRKTGLFEAALDQFGLTAIWPDPDDKMLEAIKMIKVKGACNSARQILQNASRELCERGAKVQFVACSEFSLIADDVAPKATAIDTVDVLVDAIVDFAFAR